VRAIRLVIALSVALALPGLVFGFCLKVAPLGRRCDPTPGLLGLSFGEPCRTFDPSVLYLLVPAVTLLLVVIALRVASGRGLDRRAHRDLRRT
jgi:hypothetical protein